MGYMKRMSTSVNFDYESYARGSKNVFEIWNKYKPRLPTSYFEENLLLVADFLYRIKLYKMALWQGYGRYLQQFSSVIDNDITDVNQFKNIFFPRGFEADNAKLTFRALQGHCLCSFQLERENEGRLQSQASVQKLLDILTFLRLMMQAVLSHEHLCWILYNGSLHIYTISRHLMAMGHSAQALEYLLWASVCMEMTVPLLTVKYLPWRATLYAAVCQCYYDCQAGLQAEVFARRALGKVSELSQLQEMSVSPQSPETQRSFREATVKVAVMLFKRAVYEPRRKPKGLFRPKLKSNLKEIQNLPWPRTPSERLLVELFEGSAAQFLALLEALGDSTRRPLQTGLPEEPELQEVALELLFAGISILAGTVHHIHTVQHASYTSENGVSVEGAVKFVKLLFRYEQWEMFISLASLMIPLLQGLDAPMWLKEELDLKLLVAMEPLITGQKYKYTTKESNVLGEGGQERDRSSGPVVMSDDLLALAETLYTCVCVQTKGMAPDLDLTLDIVLFLWMKCKTVFQRVQTGHSDPIRCLYKLDNCDKWMRLLWLVSEVAHSCGLAQTDPAVMAELSLRLAVALESSADSTLKSGRKAAYIPLTAGRALDSSASPPPDPTDVLSILKRTPVEQLQVAYDLLERAVESVAWGRAVSPPAGAVAIADTAQLQEVSDGHSSSLRTVCSPDTLQLFTMDLHLELLSVQHRIAIKLINISSDLQHLDSKSIRSARLSVNVEHPHQTNSTVTEPALLEKIKKNKVCRALFLMQKALYSSGKQQASSANKKLLEEAVSLLEKADIEEKRMLIENSVQEGRKERRNGVPPAPILLSRSHTSMTFMPAPYSPAQQVCWYLIFGRTSTGSNLKARLSDCHLPGTGEQVPAAGECVLRVQGLEPNEKYIFAVAAYDASGKMIGDAIGESTRPVLASPPLPLLTAWAHLAQAAYETGHYPLSVKASGVLWKHFTQASSPETEGLPEPGAGTQQPTQTSPHSLFQICFSADLFTCRLVLEALTQASPLLLQLFLSTIFMQTDIRVHEGKLFCDSLCDGGPLIWGQVARLAECERMLVALDLALWLNDSSVALQAVVECYGLLAPIIYHRIPSDSVVQVLMKCLAVLQELPGVFRQKRSMPVQESLQHMVACMTYYMAKVLRSCQENRMASAVIDMGKKLLLESTEISGTTLGVQNKPPIAEEQGAQGERSQKRPAAMQPEEEMNEQLKALEASVLKTRRLGTILHQDTNSWNKETLLKLLAPLVRGFQRRRRLRQVCSDERPWRCQLNATLALAHFTLFRRNLEQRQSGNTVSYGQLDPVLFSLPHAGTLVRWSTIRMINYCSVEFYPCFYVDVGLSGGESTESEMDSDQDTPRTQMTNETDSSCQSLGIKAPRHSVSQAQLLDTLGKTALHFRRAMVLAHWGRHWACLQWVCRTLWDQFTPVICMLEHGSTTEHPFPISLEQIYSTLTPLLLLASECLLDMIQRLQEQPGTLQLSLCGQAWADDAEGADSSLHFSWPLDDGTVVDLRWVGVLTLRTLELLHQQGRWEGLAHLAMVFNTITHERYTHLITPLLVHAQRQLLERVTQFGGPQPPQPHFARAEEVTGERITCRNFIGKQLVIKSTFPEEIHPGSHIDPGGHEICSERSRAMALVSVPLDVADTLRCFRETSGRGHYHHRALQHSRTLLLLLLAHAQQEFLQANNQNSLKVQALHELGNLHFYSGNKRASQSCWSKALDSALCQPGVLGSWDKSSVCLGSSDLPQHFLRQAGIWGCLQGAVLSAKIAQYILTSDISQQTRCCILSAQLLKALLRGSLPHPLSDWEYASYGLGRTWDCPELIPGVELFAEPFRAQVNSTVSSLTFLCHRLHSAGHSLMVLPLLSLYLYFVNTVCRDKRRTIEGRILKVQALTDLGLFSDAVRELGSLLQGERIPQPQGSYYPSDKRLVIFDLQIKKKFDTSKTLLDSANLQTLEDLVNKSLSSEVAALFGSQLVMRLTLAKTKLIVALCNTINSFPEFQGQGLYQIFFFLVPYKSPLGSNMEILLICIVQGVLLGEATRTLNSLLEALQSLGSVAEELEVAVEAKLLLSAIALQQGRAGVSANQAVSALQLLQESPLFALELTWYFVSILSLVFQAGSTSVSEVEEEDELKEDAVSLTSEVPHSAEARERLGTPLWLRCRLGAARAFASHIPGMAIRPESSEDGARLLKEGLKEAQAWGDPETQAQLLLLRALLEAHKGMNREEITPLFQEAVSLLSDRRWLSPLSALVLAKATLHLSDLKGTGTHSLYSLTQRLLQQVSVHNCFSSQLSALGESVELAEGGVVLFHQSSGPKNTYLPHGPVLAKVTLRLGHVLAQQAAHHPGTDSGQWVVAKQVLESALQLCQVSASRDRELEADILYYKGVVERWLVSLSECKPQTAVDTFLEAITVSRSHNHNLPLVHRCYLEMAMLYLQQWAQISLSNQGKENSGDTAPPPGWRRAQTPTDRPLSVQDVQQLLCWVCVRAAAQVSEASARCAKLSGSTSAKAGPLQASLRSLPAFAANDLLRAFPPPASGETEELLKSTISPFPEKESCGTGEKDIELTWVHLTRYYTHLQKLYSIANRPAVPGCPDTLWSQALDGGLALRLAQLHRFLSTHLPPYRGHCCPPDPQLSCSTACQFTDVCFSPQPRLDSSAGQESEIGLGGLDSFASASTDRELCVQWYCPALHTGHTQPVILLVFACNTRPLSTARPSGGGLSGLHCGHRWIPLHRLQAVHAQLCSLCVDAEQSAPPVASSPSSQVEKRRQARTPERGQALDPLIQEQAKQCCAEVKSLLLDLPETMELTEVPFELSSQALRDLEQCFNPARGFVLQAGSVFDWLMSLLV
ncbi:CFA54 protein, partial [Atractosteus spatula]|nr:CFA54 protein [Atractosteus spatula]